VLLLETLGYGEWTILIYFIGMILPGEGLVLVMLFIFYFRLGIPLVLLLIFIDALLFWFWDVFELFEGLLILFWFNNYGGLAGLNLKGLTF